MPVLTSSGEATSSACRSGLSAPSRVTRANANGRSNGWPFTGSGTQVHDVTVPTEETSTKSVVASWVTGSNSSGGTTTSPVRRTAADDDAVAESGEEAPDHGTGRAGVVEAHRHRCLTEVRLMVRN